MHNTNNVKLVPTNQFLTIDTRSGQECVTTGIRSCVGIVISSKKNGIVTLGHIADFNLRNKIFLKQALKDILEDYKNNGGSTKNVTIELCGYANNINNVEKCINDNFKFKNIQTVKHNSKFSEPTDDYKDYLSIHINKNKDIIVLEGYPYYTEPISLNVNNLTEQSVEVIKGIPQNFLDKMNNDYRNERLNFETFLNQKSLNEEQAEKFYKEHPVKKIPNLTENPGAKKSCIIPKSCLELLGVSNLAFSKR